MTGLVPGVWDPEQAPARVPVQVSAGALGRVLVGDLEQAAVEFRVEVQELVLEVESVPAEVKVLEQGWGLVQVLERELALALA